jgi:ABC-2 type transport system ATP-binding protein
VTLWGCTVALVAVVSTPVDGFVDGPAAGLLIGVLAGAALFFALARAPLRLRGAPRGWRRLLLARGLLLSGRSAYEEALWRGLLLGWLVAPIGAVAALMTSSALFAAAHVPRYGRRAATQLVTGLVFGAVYLATGALLAAIVAHALYNVLVAGALLVAAPVRFGQSTRRARRPTIERVPREGPATDPRPTISADVEPLSVLRDVRRTFGSTVALDCVSLQLRSGEVVGLLGPNGAGKSTAVAIMLGLRRPDTGSVELFGRDPRPPAARREIGIVLQEPSFPWTLRVREVIDLVRAHYAEPRATETLLDQLGLTAQADRQCGGLSGGQKRRLALALALAGRPRALFLDEPTEGLDVDGRRALWDILDDYVRTGGAILLTTHRIEEAEAVATRIAVLAGGRLIREGSVDSVRSEAGVTRVRVRADRLPDLPGAIGIESRRDRHTIYTNRSDELVAALVAGGMPFSDLEITPATLEDAFVVLTRAAR